MLLDLFSKYGHIIITQSYQKQYSHYQWHTWAYLNDSFEFVIQYKRNPLKYLRSHITENCTMYIYIGSLTDAEGHVGIDANNGYPLAHLSITNNNKEILDYAQTMLGGNVYRYNDSYQLVLRGEKAVEALRKTPIMHQEKAADKEFILHHEEN